LSIDRASERQTKHKLSHRRMNKENHIDRPVINPKVNNPKINNQMNQLGSSSRSSLNKPHHSQVRAS